MNTISAPAANSQPSAESKAPAPDVKAFAAKAKTRSGATIKVGGPPAPEPAAAPAADECTFVPLNKLILSACNVRKSNRDEDIEGLAESIHAKGLLQNLVVSPAKNGRGWYQVDAGGRRLRALELNVRLGRIPRDWPVPVKVVPADQAREASLAENVNKVAMNAADEAEAYAHVIADYAHGWVGADVPADRVQDERIAHCARRFGVTERHVRQRLRLAELAPEILDALREGAISLDAAKAYAGTPDHQLQLKVWKEEEKKGDFAHEARRVRDALAGKVYTADHKAVRYIGLDAYTAAGGRVDQDLFFGAEDRPLLLDPSLVDKLVREKAEREAQQLAQAEGWLDGLVKPWTGPDWAEPKAPEGYEKKYNAAARLPAEQRAGAIVAYELRQGEDGSVSLAPPAYNNHAWVKPAPARPSDPPATRDWHAERAAEQRQRRIREKAARLAAPRFDGTPFEGRVFWPHPDYEVPTFAERDDGTCYVAVLIQVPIAEMEAHLAEAEARVAAQDEAAKHEEELQAQAEAGESDGGQAEPEEDEDFAEPAS